MRFDSYQFCLFLSFCFGIYWLIGGQRRRSQNFFILVASYYFYSYWDVRFLSLIIVSSVVDYFTGERIHRASTDKERKFYLGISMIVNLGILGFFKYFNFFLDSAHQVFKELGFDTPTSLNIILPVGISFYTFQTMSYTLDIYRKKFEPVREPIAFFSYVAFFPQLVAGPIERASHLLPQFIKERKFTYAQGVDGLRLIMVGLFKKLVIADTCARIVNDTYAQYDQLPPEALLIAAFYFSIQIYGDFSGYSDIAIGTARLLGFELKDNFRTPYFARNISDFWKRWHISLSSWFRDYVYIPLGGNREGMRRHLINLLITFILSGLWHGANWTFLSWGLLHGLAYLPIALKKMSPKYKNVQLPRALGIFITFCYVTLLWVFFRATHVDMAFEYLGALTHISEYHWPSSEYTVALYYVIPFLIWEWCFRNKRHNLCIDHFPTILRYAIYYTMIIMIYKHRSIDVQFIYFQF